MSTSDPLRRRRRAGRAGTPASPSRRPPTAAIAPAPAARPVLDHRDPARAAGAASWPGGSGAPRTGRLNPFIFSMPSRIWETTARMTAQGDLLVHLGATVYRTLLGFGLATLWAWPSPRCCGGCRFGPGCWTRIWSYSTAYRRSVPGAFVHRLARHERPVRAGHDGGHLPWWSPSSSCTPPSGRPIPNKILLLRSFGATPPASVQQSGVSRGGAHPHRRGQSQYRAGVGRAPSWASFSCRARGSGI